MNRSLIFATSLILLNSLILPPRALAHDQSLHKGKPTSGEVVSAGPNSIELKTDTDRYKVTFSPETKFERGDTATTKDDIKVGEHVAVFGTKIPGGELAAHEVLIGNAPHHDAHELSAGNGKCGGGNKCGGDSK